MKKLKLKKDVKKYLLIIIGVIVFVIIIIFCIKKISYHNSNEYKLLKLGYTESDIMAFKENITSENILKIIGSEYNKNIAKIIGEKYYLKKNYEKYLSYQALHPETSYSDIIAIVNVNADNTWYHESVTKDAALNINNLVLVNKFNKLSNDYEPEDLVNASLQYSYANNRLRADAYKAFVEMCTDAKNENLTLILASGFRTYEYQKELYEYYIDIYGEEKTDLISAKPGHSEHQTGLTLDILKYGVEMRKFIDTEEFIWMQNNAYKYGFILRYPKDKNYLTGYDYEPWHYRYVGTEVANKIHEENITFDEYYAYYLEN